MQASIDRLANSPLRGVGGLIVLGSVHTELVALLEDRGAPLYSRTTDQLEVDHLSTASILEILNEHTDSNPHRLLFLWNLFEGVPKFYRDAYEQGVLGSDREGLLRGMFFQSSSPLRTEADNWFLSELRGRYDVLLKYIARNPGCSHADLVAHVREVSPGTAEQVGGYLKILIGNYRMIERRQPIFAKPNARKGRYYTRDNFLRSWLLSLHGTVAAINFRPESDLVARSNELLKIAEGHGLERLAAQIYEERSRAGVGDFNLTARIEGYWDRVDTEIDLVALDEESRTIRFGTCKRNGERLIDDLALLEGHVNRFLEGHRRFSGWRVEKVAIAPEIDAALRQEIASRGVLPQSLEDLTKGF